MSKLRIFDSARTKNVSAKGLIVVFRIVSIEESVGFFFLIENSEFRVRFWVVLKSLLLTRICCVDTVFFSDRQGREKDTKAKGLKFVLFPNCQCKRRLRRF